MTTVTQCRGCGSARLERFLDLGDMPLADALVTEEVVADPSREQRFPLVVAFCHDCALVQITEDVDPERLFVENYLYFSSYSDHLLEHSRTHALGLIDSRRLTSDSLVVEIASNDGYLLKNFVDAGVPAIGFDPAPLQSAAANALGVPTRAEFFGSAAARRLRGEGRPADVIIANNVMAHVPDPNDMVAGIAHLLAPDGVVTIENPNVWDLVDRRAFDTIYHEHVFYHSCTSIGRLVERHGLHLNDVDYFGDLHGGTNRWYVGHADQPSARLEDRLAAEHAAGLDHYDFFSGFGREVDTLRHRLSAMLHDLRGEGKRIAAYGAAAKGATLLNAAGITTDLVAYVVDRNVHKHGRFMPGTHQPIVGPEILLDDPPDVVLLLAWNFAAEILAQQTQYVANGGRFLVPIPAPELV